MFLSLKSTDQARRLEAQVSFHVSFQRQNCIFSQKPLLLLFRPSTDEMRPTHLLEGNLLYLVSTDVNLPLIEKRPPQQHLDWCLAK